MTPIDQLLLGFLGVIAAVTAIYVPGPGPLLLEEAAMAASVVVAARLRARSRTLDFLHAFLPVPLLGMLINLIGPVIAQMNPARWDVQLASVDRQLFGRMASGWRDAGGRPVWLCEAASLAYASYYVLPVASAVVLWARRRSEEFDRFIFALGVALLASYAAYFAAPAAGPRVPDALAQAQLGGAQVSAALRSFLREAERNQLDAFPSGHTAVSIVFLAQAWSLFPRQRLPFAAAVAAIIFSTVFLSLHYVVDVAAGAALAVVVLGLLRAMSRSAVRRAVDEAPGI
ncbi:MAG: phosphatase PAP2 family protein [Deltaproteobacteria bacterium]|nr:MAG: phosphatase PAP2 family protein [Deltaproteobacteria bacterium]